MAKVLTLDPFTASATLYKIYRYTAATTTFSSNLSNTTGHDLFNDTMAVDDCLYFASSSYLHAHILSIKFVVATAIAADAYTLVWEYWNGSAWTTIVPQADGTSNFSVVGTNEIWFHAPENATHVVVNAQTTTKWLRCRVTAVTNPTEGGAIGATAIQLRQNSLSFSGGTSGAPITMDDVIANTDVIAYNLVTAVSPLTTYKMYLLRLHLSQTDTTGYFKAEYTSMYFIWGNIGGTGNFTFGNSGGVPNVGYRGGFLSFNHNSTHYMGSLSGGSWNPYNCKIEIRRGQAVGYASDMNFNGTIFNGSDPLYGGGGLNMNNTFLNQSNSYTAPAAFSPNFNGCKLEYLMAYQGSVGQLARDTYIVSAGVQWSTKMVLFDCLPTTLSAGGDVSYHAGVNPGEFYKHLSINLTVKNEKSVVLAGAIVHITDTSGSVPTKWSGTIGAGSIVNVTDLTTDANGLASTDLLAVWEHKVFDPAYSKTTTNYYPFTVTVTKSGYKPWKKTYTTLDKVTEIVKLENKREA